MTTHTFTVQLYVSPNGIPDYEVSLGYLLSSSTPLHPRTVKAWEVKANNEREAVARCLAIFTREVDLA